MPKGYPRELEEYDMSKLLTVKQLAEEVFRIHPNTMYRWVQQHDMPHLRIGNRIFFRKAAIEEWMRANEKGTPEALQMVNPDHSEED